MRLEALRRYEILDTPPEKEFDHIVELSSEICDTPISLITFLDEDRQWFKAKVGVDLEETRRELSFCTLYTEDEDNEVLEITNAARDPRFQNNPLVTGTPFFRFYAGAPMIDSSGNFLGCVCVLDHEARELSDRERFFLKTMAEQAVRNLENRAENKQLRRSQQAIGESLSYAKRIQEALFQPVNCECEEPRIPDHFTFLRPLSDVSGDFYWAKEHEGYFYIAAMDCTGHGVPGGFMSMLGISFLNDVLTEKGPLSPGEILDQVRQRIIRELKGDDPLSGARDGMDAAVVKIPIDGSNSKENKEGIEVQFAGAQNPLYVIREGIGETEIRTIIDTDREGIPEGRIRPFKRNPHGIEIKGDRQPVGYDEFSKGGFQTIPLKLQRGDMLYLFSDGFADQFGGEKGKKFQYGNFKQLLVDIHGYSLRAQKERLKQSLEVWKDHSGEEQIDDVLVVGVRL